MLDFASLPVRDGDRRRSGVVFLLGLVGFGTKAGIVPLHVWLPGGASRRTLPRERAHERRHDQDGHLRDRCAC